ncbi:hypothetical protein N9D92_02375 [Gammaproteobacteria bacterium]|nr:hypothetical protein [Gammaproteobacteria bacterium]
MKKYFSLLLLALVSLNTFAYIGPGMSGGIIAAIAGFFLAIILGFWGILYYPIKRALRNRSKEKKQGKEQTE